MGYLNMIKPDYNEEVRDFRSTT
ncbi:uncharacterized protein G2W53_019359 [Senna tora]|uniref:Uncharacterized protein n=1 Tax=Senna tora TaxID=362788 RepID=A0A834TTD2_9FABA|nr:uncharacterized protein G2W53_019359 [Senna tora]